MIELPDSLLKKSQRSCKATIKYSWYKWTNNLNIHLAAWIMSIITMILLTLGTWMGWFIPHLITISLASFKVMLKIWWIILNKLPHYEKMWDTKVAMLFLILVSAIMITMFGFKKELNSSLSGDLRWLQIFSGFFLFTLWKEKQLEKLSHKQKPGESSLCNLLKKE